MRDGRAGLNRKLARATAVANTHARMRTLVTGADGFLGSHLVRALTSAGHEVFGAVFARPAGAREVRVDLTQPEQLRALPDGIEAIVHAAGSVDARLSSAQLFAVNTRATEHVLAWAKRSVLRHFVHISSVAVYGPCTLGERRSERTPRLGALLGLPYMRSKARAEQAIERSGVPYTLLRPPVVLGARDTVISRGYYDALCGEGIPLAPGARLSHRVSLCAAEGLSALVARVLEHGPLCEAVHAVDAELTFAELSTHYARALNRPLRYTQVSTREALRRRNDVGFAWLVASSRFGQHYSRERLVRQLGYRSEVSLESAIESGLSGLQGGGERLF